MVREKTLTKKLKNIEFHIQRIAKILKLFVLSLGVFPVFTYFYDTKKFAKIKNKQGTKSTKIRA